MYTPFDPLAEDRQPDVIMSFIGQSASDIRNKLQRLEGLQGYTLQDLVKEAEKVFNKRETLEEREERIRKEQEEREDKRDKRRNKELTRILATVVQGSGQSKSGQSRDLGDKRGPRVERDQCAYCKEKGHWEPPPEPRITLKVGGQPVTFLVDTGAQHSVLTEAKGPLSSKTSWVQGATGGKFYRWTTERKVHLSTGQVTHSFLLVPDCPYPLLGRDLLSKVGAQIHFQQKGATITGAGGQPLQVLTLRLEDEHRLHEDSPPSVQPLDSEWLTNYPQAWVETAGMGLAVNQPPIIINLKPSATPISIRQYSMSKEAKEGIRPHIQRLLQLGILIPCQSPWNTPLLPVNWRTEDIHPTVPNPYNLLSTLPPSHVWYTVLDLKDAFFCLRLSSQSQPIFAFEWKDPETGFSGQLTWTRLPQGFKNSPTLFDEALHRDLADFRPPDRWLSNARVTHYQAMLLNSERIQFGTATSLNPATLLPETESPSLVMHDCHQILAEVHGTRGDLTDQPLPDAEATWYTDGSSFLRNGERKAGAAVVDGKAVIWASALEPGTSAQRAELIALTQALRKAKDKKVNIYTDSRYAFATAHVHGEIYRRRGLLTSAGKNIKNREEIQDLLHSLFLPRKLSIIHCPGHQRGNDPVAEGNRMADETARAAYLLVFIDTFSGWTEAFPTKRETAQVVVKKILEEIFPRFGLPKVIGSDNGPAFVSQVSQLVARLLGINWKLHCAYRPQSSGQVERMNRTIKETLTKLTLETGTRDWVQLLPMVLFRVRNTPARHGLTPYEILYGGPPPVTDLLDSAIDPLANTPGLQDRLKALQIIQHQIWKPLAAVYRPGDTTGPHPFQIGDSVYVRRHQSRTLEPRWKGPYTVLLTTPTALKVDGIAAWVHASHVKRAPSTSTADASQDGPDEPLQWKLHRTQNPLKIRLSKIVQ
ncbi:unnamed protein product [Nyctereutes procyonoides]|uniref:Gag-Pol polyprotein n=1 Tax=Nyctereutes procyonoides TaxID=34880 RepID=A0A811ZXM6_NYCPR|nr:unnamed protein product [Nyctereutes procyonoides]CAD7693252.1 unnamed protein product [Nyctereutes procyonoides]